MISIDDGIVCRGLPAQPDRVACREGGVLPILPVSTLYYGDNLPILRDHDRFPNESVDLVYLDPPFQSGKSYNALFKEHDGAKSAAQIKAFEDTWEWDAGAARTYDEIVASGGRVGEVMEAFRAMLLGAVARSHGSSMLAYLSMMAPRLVELRRALKLTGSLYLHCDPTASHYLKILMDAVFGPGHFLNEIIWYYKGAGISPKRWGSRHDVLLWYGKEREPYFNPDPVRDEYAATTKERFSHYIGNVRGEHDFGAQELNPKGKHPDDVWQIPIIAPSANERMGYPTQKPESLLERILLSSSEEGAVVLDPFCGCGTTVAVAQRLKREWIGIDITHLAIGLIKKRLLDTFGAVVGTNYQVIGEPTDLSGACQLAEDDRHQFEHWALGLVGARASAHGKGADKGIDGVLLFQEGAAGSPHKRVIISVKSGKVSDPMVSQLRGVIENEKAALGVLLTLEDPTVPMRQNAASAGFYESPWGRHPRIQILTIKQLFDGAKIDMPPIRPGGTTFKQAPRAKPASTQLALDGGTTPTGRRRNRKTP